MSDTENFLDQLPVNPDAIEKITVSCNECTYEEVHTSTVAVADAISSASIHNGVADHTDFDLDIMLSIGDDTVETNVIVG